MLALSRKINQRIFISKGELLITLVVLEVQGDKVRLGIEAPPEVEIDREEVWDAKHAEQQKN